VCICMCVCACACVRVCLSVCSDCVFRALSENESSTHAVSSRALTCRSSGRRTVSAGTPAVLLVMPGVEAENCYPSVCAVPRLTPLAVLSYCVR
jgi:hypothetical protein